jgi:hypothetical protein
MILLIDAMNIMHSLGLNRNKEDGLTAIISIISQDNRFKQFSVIYLVVDGHPIKFTSALKKVKLVFSEYKTADELIIHKAVAYKTKQVTICTHDNEIKRALRGFGFQFTGHAMFGNKHSFKAGKSNVSNLDKDSLSPDSQWFTDLYKIKLNE